MAPNDRQVTRTLVIAVALATAACQHGPAVRYPSPQDVLQRNASATPTILVENTYARAEEKPMIARGVALANKVMATPCFKDYILHARLTECDPPDKSSEGVWNHLVANQVTVNVAMFDGSWMQNHCSHTIGLEDDAQLGVVQMNRHFVNTAEMVADNLIHEAEGHVQGYHHYHHKPTSVPYTLNAAFGACVTQVGPSTE
jgi:hypothetical protein